MRQTAIWVAVLACLVVPLAAAATSPLLAWRDPIYIAAGFAGIIALALLLMQPLLVAGDLPGLAGRRGRQMHRVIGGALVAAVLVHIAGLWITSPPDVIDALLFVSPTPFAIWGVMAMWAVVATAFLAVMRRRLRLRPQVWRSLHIGLAVVIAGGSIAHAMLIEGTMELMSKAALCLVVLVVTARLVAKGRRRI